MLATPSVPYTYSAALIVGTEPTSTCDQGNGIHGILSKILGLGNPQPEPPANESAEQAGQKKKGFLGKIAGMFKDDKQPDPPPKPPDATASPH